MVHGQYRIKFLLLVTGKKSICAIGSINQHIVFGIFNSRLDNIFFLTSDQSFVTGMRIESEYGNSGFINTKIPD